VALPFVRHHRRSFRLKGFDYGGTFTCLLTICVAGRRPLFGCLCDGAIDLSAAGLVADACWRAIPAHFPHVDLDLHTIQPDHLHGIVTIRRVGAQHVAPLRQPVAHNRRFGPLAAGSLPEIVRTYKAAVSRLLHDQAPIWQRGYYESILHDAAQIARARGYINRHPGPKR
jgi:REP element-mobilizing transposase RayT